MHFGKFQLFSVVGFIVFVALGIATNQIRWVRRKMNDIAARSFVSHLMGNHQWWEPMCYEDLNQDQVKDVIALRRLVGASNGELHLALLNGKTGEVVKEGDVYYPPSSKLLCLGFGRIAVEKMDLTMDMYDLKQFEKQHSVELEDRAQEIRASESCLFIKYSNDVQMGIDLSTFKSTQCFVAPNKPPLNDEQVCKK